jgi:hypothetical protein
MGFGHRSAFKLTFAAVFTIFSLISQIATLPVKTLPAIYIG